MHRRTFLAGALCCGASNAVLSRLALASETTDDDRSADTLQYELSQQTPARRNDGKLSYCHTRAGIVPGAGLQGAPRVVLTMNTIDLGGMDVFRSMYCMETDNLGQDWTKLELAPGLCPRELTLEGETRPVACSDFWPTWHAKSKTLLGTGHMVAYTSDWVVKPHRPRSTVYAVYRADDRRWSPWKMLPLEEEFGFHRHGAGCTQRVDLPNGEILLPISYRPDPAQNVKNVVILRCAFDGDELTCLDHGRPVSLQLDNSAATGTKPPVSEHRARGLGEPSLARFRDRYYLTLRNDERAYVTRGRDGLNFEDIRPWTFDDGQELGSYNTQQHWVTHSDALFLVYTRRGANNDHVFRHRAPLFMAQVDPEKLVVVRNTERAIVPNRGARLGNFGVTDVGRDETWVTVAEWMQPKGVDKHGSDGSVWVARIRWNRPNELFQTA